jgi:alpha/beta superfamily hydrolase
MQQRYGALPLVLAGFSFGAYVQAQVAQRLEPARLVLVGPAVNRFPLQPVASGTLVIHGEEDDVVPLRDVLDWARPQSLPIVVIPGAGHFFHGKLVELARVVNHSCAC